MKSATKIIQTSKLQNELDVRVQLYDSRPATFTRNCFNVLVIFVFTFLTILNHIVIRN